MRLLDKPMIDGDLRLVKNSESVTANAPVNGLGSRESNPAYSCTVETLEWFGWMRLLTSCLIHKIAQTNHDLREGCFDLGDLCEAKRMKLTVFLNGQFLSPRNDHSVFRNVPQSIEFFKVIPECVIKLRWMRREIGEPFGKEVAHLAKVLFSLEADVFAKSSEK